MSESKPASRRWMRRIAWIVGTLALLVCGVITVFAYLPPEEDPVIPLAEQGGGARQREDSVTGLQAAFPDLPPVDHDRAELGRLLFYDPVLSADNSMSCASCHHPDLGFSDGRTVAVGVNNIGLRRNTLSLWNVAFNQSFFWDGRVNSLEEQALIPLTHADEMGADIDDLVAELRGISDYESLFDANFDDGVTIENVVAAIAEFQRTLISDDSPFDRYAQGDFNALTASQRRGFDVFRSAQTRCFECHTYPTFTANTFHVLGVPDDPDNPDRGRVEVLNAPDAEFGFRAPGLRNVALSAPYMHDGAFDRLEEVVQFYADGGGASAGGLDVQVDEKLRGFDLTDRQVDDLIDFLYALTDEPADAIAIPESVPSGLPVVTHRENPQRELVEVSTAPPFVPISERDPQTILVRSGESIQDGVDQAQPGDIVQVEPGIYRETIYVDTPGLTIQGLLEGDGISEDERPWLIGDDTLSDGFNTTGDDFTLEGFGFKGFIGNAVLTTGAERIVYRDLIIEGTGENAARNTIYGVYPVECTDVLIENVSVTGIADAAIYVGQSRGPIIVRNNTVFGNVTGIEIENSVGAEVYDNHVYNNAGGILVFVLPNNPSRVGLNTRVYNNLVEENNHVNFGAPGSTVSDVPSGTGMMIVAADYTEMFNNTVRNNKTAGIIVTSLYQIYDRDTEFDLGPLPEHNWIHDNFYENNGYAIDESVKDEGFPGSDIIWTTEGWSNSFDEPNASKFPPILPGRNWSDPARRALWRTYDIMVRLMG